MHRYIRSFHCPKKCCSLSQYLTTLPIFLLLLPRLKESQRNFHNWKQMEFTWFDFFFIWKWKIHVSSHVVTFMIKYCSSVSRSMTPEQVFFQTFSYSWVRFFRPFLNRCFSFLIYQAKCISQTFFDVHQRPSECSNLSFLHNFIIFMKSFPSSCSCRSTRTFLTFKLFPNLRKIFVPYSMMTKYALYRFKTFR